MVDSGFGTPGAGGQYQPAAAPQSVPTPTPAESWTMVASTGDLFSANQTSHTPFTAAP